MKIRPSLKSFTKNSNRVLYLAAAAIAPQFSLDGHPVIPVGDASLLTSGSTRHTADGREIYYVQGVAADGSLLNGGVNGDPPVVLVPIGGRNHLPSALTTVYAAGQRINQKLYITNNSASPITLPRIRVFNGYWDATMSYVQNTNAVDHTASIEYPAGSAVYTQLTYGGAATLTLSATDTMNEFDPVVLTILPGTTAVVRMCRTIPVNGTAVTHNGSTLAAMGEVTRYGAIGSQDYTLLNDAVTNNAQTGFPGWVLGEAANGTKSALICGDSIDAGISENADYTSDASGRIGFFGRFLPTKGYNTINVGRGSTSATQVATKDMSILLGWLSGINFTLKTIGWGRNDLSIAGPPTAAQIATVIGQAIAKMPRTARTLQRDILVANLTSSDTWATVEGQSRAAGNATNQEIVRNTLNGLIAAKSVPGVTDSIVYSTYAQTLKADAVTVVWQAAYTGDGVHPKAIVNSSAVAGNSAYVI